MSGVSSPFPAGCARKYRAVRLLGSGGFGSVYEATQLALTRRVVVKVLHPEAAADAEQVQRFINEARVTAQLRHPNVVVLLDFDVESGAPWIAYEYVDGEDLRRALSRGPMKLAEAVDAAIQVAAALEHAHARDILHRDIKPENVLRDRARVCKVADFGLAKWRHGSALQTRDGLILGTPAYLSPEQILGRPAGAGSDLYALGAMLFELLSGQPPFAAPTPMEVLEKHLRDEPPRLGELGVTVPGDLEALVSKLLRKRPQERPASAAAVRSALEQLSLETPANRTVRIKRSAVSPAPMEVVTPHRRRAWLLLGGAAALTAAAMLVPRQERLESPGAPAPMAVARPPERSSKELKELVNQRPRDWPLYLDLAVALEKEGAWGRASSAYEYIAQNARGLARRDQLRLLAGLGRAYANGSRPSEAENAYRKALALSPGEPAALRGLAVLLATTDAKRGEEAIRYLERVLERDPTDVFCRRLLAIRLMEAGRVTAALPELERVITASPDDLAARKWLGLSLRQQPAKALVHLTAVAEKTPQDTDVMLAVADCFTLLGKPQEAQQWLERASAAAPGSSASERLADAWSAAGRLADAEPLYLAVLQRDPQNVMARLNLAKLLLDTHRPAQARGQYEEAVRRHPDHVFALVQLANNRWSEKRLEEAEQLYTKALAIDPRDETACVMLAIIAEKGGRLERALELNRRAMDSHPHLWERQQIVGMLLRRLKQPAEAEQVLRRVIREHPQAAWAYRDLAQLLEERKDFDAAKQILSQGGQRKELLLRLAQEENWAGAEKEARAILAGSEREQEVLGHLAESVSKQGRRTEALDLYAKYVAGPGDDRARLIEAGALAGELGEALLAETALRRAIALAPDDPHPRLLLGRVLEAGNRLPEAVAEYAAAARHPRWRHEALSRLAEIDERTGDRAAAERRYRELLVLDPAHAATLAQLASLLQKQGRTREALPYYEKAVESQPSSSWTHIGLAIARKELGDLAGALASARAAAKLEPKNVDIAALCAEILEEMARKQAR